MQLLIKYQADVYRSIDHTYKQIVSYANQISISAHKSVSHTVIYDSLVFYIIAKLVSLLPQTNVYLYHRLYCFKNNSFLFLKLYDTHCSMNKKSKTDVSVFLKHRKLLKLTFL